MKGKQFVSLMIAAVVLSATLAVPIFAQIGEPAKPIKEPVDTIKQKLQIKDGNYVISIPKELVEKMGLKEGDEVSLVLQDNTILIKPIKEPAKPGEPAEPTFFNIKF